MNTAFTHPQHLVTTDWLAAHLDHPGVQVLDCTTHLPPKADFSLYDVVPGRGDFEQAHIPGAAFVDIEHDVSEPHPRLHFMLPDADRFARAMEALGISDDTLVVTYATAFHWWATRMWWMLRVFGHERVVVLDGGFQKWKADGHPVESGIARERPSGRFTARPPRREMVATREDVLAAIGRDDICTVNGLRAEQHQGRGGVHYGRRGHVTGSINIPAVEHVNPDNTFKSPAELQKMFAGPRSKPRVIAYCGGGIAATSIALVLDMLGHHNVQVYDASLTEWAADPTLPMTQP
jgi:thiosulfate/3-mercaptopyruvate sulfurtransferase